MDSQPRVLVYGDSLTWGAIPVPHVVPTGRHPRADRWPVLLGEELGVEIIEEGLGGRTTNADDPLDPRLNGAAHLPTILASHVPLDLVVLLLGTNDLKVYFDRSPFDIGVGALALVNLVKSAHHLAGTTYAAPDVLLVALRSSPRSQARGTNGSSPAHTRSRRRSVRSTTMSRAWPA